MTGNQRHIIRKQVLDVTYLGEQNGPSAKAELSSLFEEHILPELDRIFSSFCPEGEEIRIGKLELDLGELNLRESPETLKRVIGEKLRDQIRTELIEKEEKQEAAGNLERISTPMHRLDLLEEYLLQGRLGNGRTTDAPGINELMQQALSADKETLIARLRRLAPSDDAVRRLATQFEPALREALMQALLGPDLTMLKRNLSELEKLAPVLSRALAGTTPVVIRQLAAESAMATALAGRKDPPPQTDFFVEYVYRLARQTGRQPGTVLAQIRASLKAAGKPMAGSTARTQLEKIAFYLKKAAGEELGARESMDQAKPSLLKHTETGEPKAPEAPVEGAALSERIARAQQHYADGTDDPAKKRELAQLAEEARNRRKALQWRQDPELEDEIFIQNAGLVLLWPFFYYLFDYLGYLEEGAFRSEEFRHRAIYLLEYIASGQESEEEHALILNKILCGMELSAALTGGVKLTEKEKEECDNLIRTAASRWEAIGKMSVEGFRMSFLPREGRLQKKFGVEGWELYVERKAFDPLLDRLPWNLSLVKTRLMEAPIYVEW